MEIKSLLIKVSVDNVQTASQWYQDKLGFVEKFSFGNIWIRMKIPKNKDTTYGLSKDGHPTNSGGQVTTFVVENIEQARQELINNGVPVGPIENPGAGIKLAFFDDLDGNSLGLREEPDDD